jgi:hypothetical protein
MTTKLSISVPDDVAEFLQAQDNTSAFVTMVIRSQMLDARRARQRAAALAYAQHMRERTAEQIEADRTMYEHNADIALRGAEW